MANEKRLIDANALAARYRDVDYETKDTEWTLRDILFFLEKAPTVDAVEVVHGRWVSRICSYGTPKCSVCDWSMPYSEDSRLDAQNYCPNCGAKMDGDGNG